MGHPITWDSTWYFFFIPSADISTCGYTIKSANQRSWKGNQKKIQLIQFPDLTD